MLSRLAAVLVIGSILIVAAGTLVIKAPIVWFASAGARRSVASQ